MHLSSIIFVNNEPLPYNFLMKAVFTCISTYLSLKTNSKLHVLMSTFEHLQGCIGEKMPQCWSTQCLAFKTIHGSISCVYKSDKWSSQLIDGYLERLHWPMPWSILWYFATQMFSHLYETPSEAQSDLAGIGHLYHWNESVPERIFILLGGRKRFDSVKLYGKLSRLGQTSKVYMLHLTLSRILYCKWLLWF